MTPTGTPDRAAITAGTGRALVIASQIGGLRGCHNDADLVQALLEQRGFVVTSLRERSATRTGILEAFEGLITATNPGDRVVMYYAGHGSRQTTTTAGIPGELRFILPTDIAETTHEDFRGILSDELTVLQARLTARTPNVTTVLDCCYSARMARGDALTLARVRSWDARWPVDAVIRRRVAAQHAFAQVATWSEANPDAVRLVACGSHQRALERASRKDGPVHGQFTAALTAVLESDSTASWQSIMNRVRNRVLARSPDQRPEGEGPISRVPFTLETRSGGVPLPVRTDPATSTAWLDGARIHGIRPGDEYLLSRPGFAPDITTSRLARVVRVSGDAALLQAVGESSIPSRAVAHLHGRGVESLAVRVLGSDPDRLTANLAGLQGVEVVTDETSDGRPEVASVEVTADRFMLRDGAGLPLYASERSLDATNIADLRSEVESLAVALRLRSLSPEGDELSAPVALVVETSDGPVVDGAVLHPGARLRVAAAQAGTGTCRVYANVLDVGVAGRVEVLNSAERAGMTLDPGESRAIGERVGGLPPELWLSWPPAVPSGSPRYETVLAIFSDSPQDLSGLNRNGVRARLGPSFPDRLTHRGTRWAIRRVTFVVCPGDPTCDHRSGTRHLLRSG